MELRKERDTQCYPLISQSKFKKKRDKKEKKRWTIKLKRDVKK